MSGGTSSYFGYEYQFYVSVLLALLAHKKPEFVRLRVETSFGQDAAIDFQEIEAEDEKTLCLAQYSANSTLQVQVKTRTRTRQWGPADIRDLLLKKDESKSHDKALSVLERLASAPEERFVFITNGSVSPKLAGLLSDEVGSLDRESPTTAEGARESIVKSVRSPDLHNHIDKLLRPEVLNRIYIYDNLRIQDVKIRVERLLTRDYGIPITESTDKVKELLDLIRDCALRRAGRDSISSEDITQTVGSVEIALFRPHIEEVFQETATYREASDVLDCGHLVVLAGEPAVGKTALGSKIVNDYIRKRYFARDVRGHDSYLEVFRACREPNSVIFFMDDPFGDEVFDTHLGTALGNQFDELIMRLNEAKGRIKVVITTRANVLGQAIHQTKLTQQLLERHKIYIPQPNEELKKRVLEAHLDYQGCTQPTRDTIDSTVSSYDQFDNLLHIRQFANDVSSLTNPAAGDVITTIENSRPSAYALWLEAQLPESQLFLYVIWATATVNQAAYSSDMSRIYDLLTPCFNLSPRHGLGSHFDSAKRELLEQDRVQPRGADNYDFIHPQLKSATKSFLESQAGFNEFIYCAVNALRKSTKPLDQSIAAAIVIFYYDRLESPLDLLETLYESPYLQVRDTIGRLATDLFDHTDKKTRQFARKVSSIYYEPYDCEVDSNGYIVVKPEAARDLWEGVRTYTPEDQLNALTWMIGFDISDRSELLALFKKCVASRDYFSVLNAFERYHFVDWLTDEESDVGDEDVVTLLDDLSLDPITFVRFRVAHRIGRWVGDPGFERIFQTLCYDSSPFVKIEALEEVIVPNWVDQTEDGRDYLLDLVVDMLNDPVVRRRAAKRLVGQSGGEPYHGRHTLAEKRQWFKAVAFKLLEYDFELLDDFDRFLAALDEYFSELPIPYRTNLLKSLADYLQRNPHHAIAATSDFRRIILDENPTSEELDIILNVISQLPPLAKSDVCFQLARRYGELPDERFREFVHHSFFIESPDELMLTRVGSLLGFLNNSRLDIDELPAPVKELADDLETAIEIYVHSQTDDFKLMVIFYAFGYEEAHNTAVPHYNLHDHSIVRELIEYFITEKAGTDHSIFVASVVLKRGYYRGGYYSEKQEWFEYVDLLLETNSDRLGRAVCEIIFASNIWSSVHSLHDWLILLARLLTHPRDVVQSRAFALFDDHLDTIYDHLASSLKVADWQEEIEEIWFSREFWKLLGKQSVAVREYVNTVHLLNQVEEKWASLSIEAKRATVAILRHLVDPAKFHINTALAGFLERMRDRLSETQYKKLHEVLYVKKRDTQIEEIVGKSEQLERDKALKNLFPRFNWDKYLFEGFSEMDTGDEPGLPRGG